MSPSTSDVIAMDDAGGGNILGGVVIGALQGETYSSRIIGPEWFSLGSGVKPIVSATVLEIVNSGGSPANVVLCRSDMFDQAARDLERLGFSVSRAVINGSLQDRTEEDFYRHLIELGLPEYVMSMFPDEDSDKSRCYRDLNEYCIRFLMSDFEARQQTAKQNCRTFKKLEGTRITRRPVAQPGRGRARRCVECGEYVRKDAMHVTAGDKSFYTHRECSPATRQGGGRDRSTRRSERSREDSRAIV